MSESREIAAVDKLKNMIGMEYIQKKFMEILGDRAPSFLASVLNSVQMTPALRDAEPKSVLTAAMAAAVIDLPVDKNLGFSAIVPYKEKGRPLAQFQIMTRGYVQLAQRSGQYADINVTEVYEDEMKGYDILSGSVELTPVKGGWREKSWDGDAKAEDHIAGYAATIKLLSGFTKVEYWPVKKIDAHGKRFSKSFDRESSPWKTNRAAMRAKTVLKNTIAKWGPLSIQLQRAVTLDQRVAQPTFGNESLEESMDFDDNPENDGPTVEKGDTSKAAESDTEENSASVKAPNETGPKKVEAQVTDDSEYGAFLLLDRKGEIQKIVELFDNSLITDEERKSLRETVKPIQSSQDLWVFYSKWKEVVSARSKKTVSENPNSLEKSVAALEAIVDGENTAPLSGTVEDDQRSLGIF